jgi:hypothetical protein
MNSPNTSRPDKSMVRYCIGCDAEIGECFGFGIARDILAVQDGTRKLFPRELCGICGEIMYLYPDMLEQWLERRDG